MFQNEVVVKYRHCLMEQGGFATYFNSILDAGIAIQTAIENRTTISRNFVAITWGRGRSDGFF
jgi:hypothetical protein